MTPKVARYLASRQPATPCLVVDVDRVEENFRVLSHALPLARIYYAVKANPARPILDRLVGLDSRFDAASFEEVRACLDAGARPDAISYGNTIKKVSAIRAAYAAGVRLFAFDSAEELAKLAEHAPGASVYCRILVDNMGADWPLSRKFGTTVDYAKTLMLSDDKLGQIPTANCHAFGFPSSRRRKSFWRRRTFANAKTCSKPSGIACKCISEWASTPASN